MSERVVGASAGPQTVTKQTGLASACAVARKTDAFQQQSAHERYDTRNDDDAAAFQEARKVGRARGGER